MTERTGVPIHNKARRLERWMVHFEEQFSWLSSQEELAVESLEPQWLMSCDAPSVVEFRKCLQSLKQGKYTGPDEFPPTLYKYGEEILAQALINIITSVWEE